MDERQLIEEATILAEVLEKRRAEDPLYIWEPTPKQKPFIDSVLYDKKPENWFVAANRSGKSDAGAYIGACLARFGRDPKSSYGQSGIEVRDRATSGWVVSLDFPSSRDIIQPKYFDNGMAAAGASHDPFIPDREIADGGWRIADQVLKLKNGSIIGFKSADSGRKKFQGTDKDWIQFDEEPPKDIYEESVIRIGAGRRLKVFGTCTLLPPEGQLGGVTWVYSDIIKEWEINALDYVDIFGASIYDNPYLDANEIKRLEAIYPEGTTQRRIRLGGEWLPGLAGARAYPNFNRVLHVVEQEWPPLERKPISWFWDFNVEPMVAGIGQRDGKLFRVFREMVLDEGNIQEICQMFYDILPSHKGEIYIYGDATAKGRTSQTGKSDYQLIMNNMRHYGVPIRLKVPETNPPVPDRVNSVVNALKNENGEIGVEIDPSCKELITDFEQVLRDGRGGIKKTYNRKDPYFRRSHITDAFGYWASYEQPVRSNVQNLGRRIVPKMPVYAFMK